tara:strand:- start:1326 stop:1577 length:252 start_codon:yes stop_codon:yes gene_type:complete
MAKQYKITITLTFDEDLKDKTLSREDLPGLDDEPTPAPAAILHVISGKAWDVCDDAGLAIKDYDYDIEELDINGQNELVEEQA